MSLTKITSTVINTLSSFFSINSSTGAITTNVPDLIGLKKERLERRD
jgi:hypothetical protein